MTNSRDSWQRELIDSIVTSMEKNFIGYQTKTKEEWTKLLENEFESNFSDLQTEDSIAKKYKSKFPINGTVLYFVPRNTDVTQKYIDENVRDESAVILQDSYEARKNIYCVINKKLDEDVLFNGRSYNEIEIPIDFEKSFKKENKLTQEGREVIDEALTRAAYTQFADKVTKILQNLTHDEHFSFAYYPYFLETVVNSDLFKERKVFSDNTAMNMTITQDMILRSQTEGFGFYDRPINRPDILPSDIGYLKINEIFNVLHSDMRHVKQRVFDLMNSLQAKKSIILDLRDCPGGTPQGMTYIASFFFDSPQHLTTYQGKTSDGKYYEEPLNTLSLEELKPTKSSPLVDLSKNPLIVLISEGTFSAGEELAYGMQQSGRAVLIGTQTKGGNHFTRPEPLLMGNGAQNQHFYMLIPSARSINPISGTNWEDGPQSQGQAPGVRPDYVVPEDKDALLIAVDMIAENRFSKALNKNMGSTTAMLISQKVGGVESLNRNTDLSVKSSANKNNLEGVANPNDKDTKYQEEPSTHFNPTPFSKTPKPKK